MILFKDAVTEQQKLYSIGQNETNYHHLGISQIEAEDQSVFFREVTAFKDLCIVDISAGHRTSHVIIKGDKDLKERLQEHQIDDKSMKGIVHFYKDAEGKIVWLSEAEYESKKEELPDICLATKYPINYIEELKSIPDLN